MGQSMTLIHERLTKIKKIKAIVTRLKEEKTQRKVTDLKISGDDLIKIGFPKGRIIENILNSLLINF